MVNHPATVTGITIIASREAEDQDYDLPSSPSIPPQADFAAPTVFSDTVATTGQCIPTPAEPDTGNASIPPPTGPDLLTPSDSLPPESEDSGFSSQPLTDEASEVVSEPPPAKKVLLFLSLE